MAGVNVKMGVSGVAQFKQSMKESQAAVKSLDAALKLNEATLKANGDQEAYLQTKTELLNRQIEEQRKVVDQASSALETMANNKVSKTSTAFQNMQAQLYKAQTDLANMENELNGVGEAGEEAQSGVSHMNQALQRIGTNVSFESVTEGIEKITGTLEKAATAAWNLGKKIVQATLGGASWADELATEASVWEIPAEDLYRMRETARIIDTDAETILSARDKLKKGREESGKEFMGSLAYLHIDPNGMSDIDLFWKAGEAIAALGKEEDKVHYAQTLFGKSWRELIPLFSAGREEYEKVYDTWDWIGDEQLEKLTTLDDKYQELRSEWEAVQLQFQAQMAEVLTPVMETLTGLLKEFNTYLQSEDGQQMLASLGEAISGLFEDLTTINPAEVIGKITEAVNGLKDGFKWIKDHKEGIVNAIKAIGVAFGLLKLAGLAAEIGRIVTGLRGLPFFGGGQGNQMNVTQPGRPGGTYGANAIAAGGEGTVLFDTIAAGMMSTLAVMKEDARLKNWWTAGGGDVNQWAQYGVDNGYLTQEQAQQNIDFMTKMDEFAEMASKGTSGGASFAEEFTDSSDRMTQVAGEMSESVSESSRATAEMSSAAVALMDLPGLIQTAVINGMSSVNIIIDASGIDAMQPRIAGGISDKLVKMTQ